jgi:hypothetical protein
MTPTFFTPYTLSSTFHLWIVCQPLPKAKSSAITSDPIHSILHSAGSLLISFVLTPMQGRLGVNI